MAKDPKTGPMVVEGDSRIAPDPLCAVLPAISALAAIASVAAINWVGQERLHGRPRPKRRVDVALRELESCCMGLAEIFRRLARNPRLIAGDSRSSTAPLKFGVLGARIDAATARLYHQLMNDVASMLVLASQSAFDVMSAIEDGEIEAPEQLFFGFAEQQERLTALIQNRAAVKTIVETGLVVADALTELVRALKGHKVGV